MLGLTHFPGGRFGCEHPSHISQKARDMGHPLLWFRLILKPSRGYTNKSHRGTTPRTVTIEPGNRARRVPHVHVSVRGPKVMGEALPMSCFVEILSTVSSLRCNRRGLVRLDPVFRAV
jgi:hypothetical protein